MPPGASVQTLRILHWGKWVSRDGGLTTFAPMLRGLGLATYPFWFLFFLIHEMGILCPCFGRIGP